MLLSGAILWLGRNEADDLSPLLHTVTTEYFSPTNLRGLALVVSRFVLVAALGGAGLWLFRPGAHADVRIGLAIALLPGLLLAGGMTNLMADSHRMMLFPAPILALNLAALVLWLWEQHKAWTWLPVVAVGGLCLAATWPERILLAAQVEHAGLYDGLAGIAAPIQKAHGWLLLESAPIAASMEHLFGIPTLAVDGESHADLCPMAERAWQRIMRTQPKHAYYFLTPFQPPYSEYFTFTWERRFVYRTQVLPHASVQLPTQMVAWERTLSLYRMALRLPGTADREHPVFPQALIPDGGNIGLRGFANVCRANWPVRGVALPAQSSIRVPLDSETPQLKGDELDFIFNGPFRLNQKVPRLESNCSGIHKVQWIFLADDWWVLRIRGELRLEPCFNIRSPVNAILADVQIAREGVHQSLATGWPAADVCTRTLAPVRARWTRSHAAFTLSAPHGTAGELFLYLAPPQATEPNRLLTVTAHGTNCIATVRLAAGGPQWFILNNEHIGFTPENPVVTLNTKPFKRFDPDEVPQDKGVQLIYAVATD